MNRRNLTIVAIAFLLASLATWATGDLMFDHTGPEERKALLSAWEAHASTNSGYAEIQKLADFYFEQGHDSRNDVGIRDSARQQYFKCQDDLRKIDAQTDAYNAEAREYASVRTDRHSKVNIAALCLGAISGVCFITLFITEPSKFHDSKH